MLKSKYTSIDQAIFQMLQQASGTNLLSCENTDANDFCSLRDWLRFIKVSLQLAFDACYN